MYVVHTYIGFKNRSRYRTNFSQNIESNYRIDSVFPFFINWAKSKRQLNQIEETCLILFQCSSNVYFLKRFFHSFQVLVNWKPSAKTQMTIPCHFWWHCQIFTIFCHTRNTKKRNYLWDSNKFKSELQWNAKTVIVLQCFHLTLILTWTFHEASAKNWKKSFIAFQCKGRTLWTWVPISC